MVSLVSSVVLLVQAPGSLAVNTLFTNVKSKLEQSKKDKDEEIARKAMRESGVRKDGSFAGVTFYTRFGV